MLNTAKALDWIPMAYRDWEMSKRIYRAPRKRSPTTIQARWSRTINRSCKGFWAKKKQDEIRRNDAFVIVSLPDGLQSASIEKQSRWSKEDGTLNSTDPDGR
jgi:hypothetical protein